MRVSYEYPFDPASLVADREAIEACRNDPSVPVCEVIERLLRASPSAGPIRSDVPLYESTRIRFDGGGFANPDPEDFYQKHPAGTLVRVYYNPSDPGMSVLEPGRGLWGPVAELVFVDVCASLIVLGVLVALVQWLRKIGTLDYPTRPP